MGERYIQPEMLDENNNPRQDLIPEELKKPLENSDTERPYLEEYIYPGGDSKWPKPERRNVDPMFQLEFGITLDEATLNLCRYEEEYHNLISHRTSADAPVKFDSPQFEAPYRISKLEEMFKELRNRGVKHPAIDRLKEKGII